MAEHAYESPNNIAQYRQNAFKLFHILVPFIFPIPTGGDRNRKI